VTNSVTSSSEWHSISRTNLSEIMPSSLPDSMRFVFEQTQTKAVHFEKFCNEM